MQIPIIMTTNQPLDKMMIMTMKSLIKLIKRKWVDLE